LIVATCKLSYTPNACMLTHHISMLGYGYSLLPSWVELSLGVKGLPKLAGHMQLV
jgi:hypothetical protein